ncbi:hypothetical protein C9975_03410 [Thalassospira xiamenensis]|nr:hypothetical protein C9975_03410 [Thalassospira xiamenensis]
MIDWIEQHSTLLQTAVSLATLLVWIFYAQLLFQNYRRVRRPKIVINQMLGNSENARFLISNMSQEAIHIETVVMCLGGGQNRVCQLVTDADPDDGTRQSERNEQNDQNKKTALSARLDEVTLQGPLPSGRCIELGAMQRLLRRFDHATRRDYEDAAACNPVRNGEDCRVEIIVIGVYSSEKGVIGASRSFIYDRNGQLRPEEVQTTQHTGFFARRRMARLHSRYI